MHTNDTSATIAAVKHSSPLGGACRRNIAIHYRLRRTKQEKAGGGNSMVSWWVCFFLQLTHRFVARRKWWLWL